MFLQPRQHRVSSSVNSLKRILQALLLLFGSVQKLERRKCPGLVSPLVRLTTVTLTSVAGGDAEGFRVVLEPPRGRHLEVSEVTINTSYTSLFDGRVLFSFIGSASWRSKA
ncbi:hypothetical protein J6590_020140 [Homalodisca vitripennis]|nr:hypothetical protein J6590_020140 [Homalodisca vitripennis]